MNAPVTRRVGRLAHRFADLAGQSRAGLVTFLTAGDPDLETSRRLLIGLPAAGADVIELGMPFSDPMADGPAIQQASQRALKAGGSLKTTLTLAHALREADAATPLVLMGYYNPIFVYGVEAFCRDAAAAGVDGLIVVDLPPEEADELREPASRAGIDFIVLTAPTTDGARLPVVLAKASGFVYHVSVTGVTGTASASAETIAAAVAALKRHTTLPVAVGFGIKTPEQAAVVARLADAAVVGSALVGRIAAGLDDHGHARPGLVDDALAFVAALAQGVRTARRAGGSP